MKLLFLSSLLLVILTLLPGCVYLVTAGTGTTSSSSASSSASSSSTFVSFGRFSYPSYTKQQKQHPQSQSYRRGSSASASTSSTALHATSLTAATATATQQQQQRRRQRQQVLHHLRQAPAKLQHFLIRPFLRIKSQATTKQRQTTITTTTTTTTDEAYYYYHDLTKPIFDESTWQQQTGREYIEHTTEMVNALADTGRIVVLQRPGDGNPWIEWKQHSTVVDNDNNHNNNNNSYDPTITVYKGTSRVAVTTGYGAAAPWIKTVAMIPHMTPHDMVQLMMDSTRVKTYNAWSTGRVDLWTAQHHHHRHHHHHQNDKNSHNHNNNNNNNNHKNNHDNNDASQQEHWITKIVRNRTQPPMGAKPMVATTLLHARPYGNNNSNNSDNDNNTQSWLLVSRAIGGTYFDDNDDNNNNGGATSEMLLGVNLFEAVPGVGTRMTAVTHIYSRSIPSVLAERLGVKSAIQFVKDMRGAATTAATVEQES
eukprot:scaffold9129_cov150-Amphora_coffeaeformis.AAC.1